MNKYLVALFSLIFSYSSAFSASLHSFHHRETLKTPTHISKQRMLQLFKATSSQKYALIPSQKKIENTFNHIKHQFFQQTYFGIPIIGANVNIHKSKISNHEFANGRIAQDIHIPYTTIVKLQGSKRKQQTLSYALTQFSHQHNNLKWHYRKARNVLQIAILKNKAIPVYHVSFYAFAKGSRPHYEHIYIDANDSRRVIKQWNAVASMHFYHNYDDIGLGGNENTGKYHYGKDGLPNLPVERFGNQCFLQSAHVRLVNLFNHDDEEFLDGNHFTQPYVYNCGDEYKDTSPFRGAYSPSDDAFYFAHTLIDMYQDWYKTKVLPYELVVRIHRHDPDDADSDNFDNAFWNPMNNTMNFGDGDPYYMYPLVSLEILAHEVSHGFTQEHANMAYHDQSGSLNESYSDMAGVAANAFLRKQYPKLYLAHYGHDDIEWATGRNVMRDKQAFRYFDQPSKDTISADCYAKVDGCQIDYLTLKDSIMKSTRWSTMQKQMMLVHTGSGIFNKAFYELAHEPNWDIKKAFAVMMSANRDGYWTEGGLEQTTYFEDAACGAVDAARALHYQTQDVVNAFQKVGLLLDKKACRS